MKDLLTTVNESADKDFKAIFDLPIKLNRKAFNKLSALGIDFRHEHDTFKVTEDGDIHYTCTLMTGDYVVHVNKVNLNRFIHPLDIRRKIKVVKEPASNTMSVFKSAPLNLFRAVLHALCMKQYTVNGQVVELTDIDYTAGDFAKDKLA